MINLSLVRSKICMSLFFCCATLCIMAQERKRDSLAHIYARDKTDATTFDDYFLVRLAQSFPQGFISTRQLDRQTAIVSKTQLLSISSDKILWKLPANNHWKFPEPHLADKLKDGLQTMVISSSDLSQLLSLLKSEFAYVSIRIVDTVSSSVVVKANKSDLLRLMADPLVIFISRYAGASAEIGIIGYNRAFHGINELAYHFPQANGKNIVVGVKEQKMEPEDLDLYKRVLSSSIESDQVSNHATVISSIIGGAGNSYYDGLGIANGCQFFSSSFDRLFADDATVLSNAGVTVQNHSYGTVVQSFYGPEALSYDAQAYSTGLLHIFSSGNQGTTAATEGRYAGIQGYANLTGNFKMAKNVVTVGAIDNKGVIPDMSSAGPLYDGRLAPQLIALGPNGTSDAAAMVTGTAAVLQQLFADSNSNQLPSSFLIKAILYTAADDIYRKGIDFKTGYGQLNSFRAVALLNQRTYFTGNITAGSEWTRMITVPAGAAQLKATLAWNDIAASLNNDQALVNDLDLELISISNGEVFKPWVLNTAPKKDSLEKLPVRARDSLNTAEQISVDLPSAGQYQLRVKANVIGASPVSFGIAYWTDTLHTFRFTSPLHAADIHLQEDAGVEIRWAGSFGKGSEAGDLFVSYDRGNSWELIAAELPLASTLYLWELPRISPSARLKMKTSFGEFVSVDFAIAPATRLTADFVCEDSVRLSWNKQIGASSYDLFTLATSPYLQQVINTADTFLVIDRKQYSSLVYAVQPRLMNALPAARSIAINITLQGVDCFYKTLNYVLEDGNRIRMILELSAPSYADSVFFEQVSETGVLLGVFDQQKTRSGESVYTTTADQRAFGTIYIRGGIRLKNGGIRYTSIIPVFTSGSNNVLFYPNPVSRGEVLKYIMKQGVSPDCRLQIYNAYGLLVKEYPSLPRTIDISFLTAGMYFFRVTDQSGSRVANEKIIIP